jgi:membrane protease YdiL (CAAX protease family)
MVKRHPLIAFFVLTYALSWWPWILHAQGVQTAPIASFGPFVAALAVLALTEGKAGILGLFRRMIRWRVNLGWYAVALLLPVAMAGGAALLNVALGAEPPTAADLGRWTALPASFAIVLLVPGMGGAWEEPGWRGYALPRMQARWSALLSGVVLALLITLWHLPLMVTGEIHFAEVASIMTAMIVINWLFNQARGSVLVIMICHAANNTISGRYFFPMFDGADAARQAWLLAVTWGVAALAVVIIGGPRDFSRTKPRQVEPGFAADPAGPDSPALVTTSRKD